ncbi:MAG TPA: type II toxin-antitoxin system YafQ family toxin [Ramlibacter sp.]
MKEIVFTRRFERDFRRLKKRLSSYVLDYETLECVFELLQRGKSLPEAFREHGLEGEYAGYTECHLDADWLLVYRAREEIRIALRLIQRTRKTLGFETPAAKLQAVLH